MIGMDKDFFSFLTKLLVLAGIGLLSIIFGIGYVGYLLFSLI